MRIFENAIRVTPFFMPFILNWDGSVLKLRKETRKGIIGFFAARQNRAERTEQKLILMRQKPFQNPCLKLLPIGITKGHYSV
jgi:hypothetical protein